MMNDDGKIADEGELTSHTASGVDKKFQLATLYLIDGQRLIAAFRAQRWDVVKWGAAINIGLAAASISHTTSLSPRLALLSLSILISIGGWYSMRHYSCSLARMLNVVSDIEDWFAAHGVDYRKFVHGADHRKFTEADHQYSDDINRDREEQNTLTLILVFSIIPSLISVTRL